MKNFEWNSIWCSFSAVLDFFKLCLLSGTQEYSKRNLLEWYFPPPLFCDKFHFILTYSSWHILRQWLVVFHRLIYHWFQLSQPQFECWLFHWIWGDDFRHLGEIHIGVQWVDIWKLTKLIPWLLFLDWYICLHNTQRCMFLSGLGISKKYYITSVSATWSIKNSLPLIFAL